MKVLPEYKPKVVKQRDNLAWQRVEKLEVETFKKTVIEDTENVWVVAFVSDNCKSCKTLAVEWERLTKKTTITMRKVKFGYVDTAEASSDLIIDNYCGDNKVHLTPTILVYGADKRHPTEYTGDYKVASMNTYIADVCDSEGFGYGHGLRETRAGSKTAVTVTKDVETTRSKGRLIAGAYDKASRRFVPIRVSDVKKRISASKKKSYSAVP